MDKDRILEKLGISQLNDMQRDTSDAILRSDKDVVVLSPTGSGKTLAYLLPLAECLDPQSDKLQAVVIVPGRELALQSCDVFKGMGTGLRAACLYGGRVAMDEHRTLKKVRPQIVFATPGRFNDHIAKANIEPFAVRWLVIDEFDKCLRMGFQAEMEEALDNLPNVERRILLSATEAEQIPSFVRMGRSAVVDYRDTTEQTPDRIGLFAVRSPEKDKLGALKRLLCIFGNDSTIVFMNFRDGVERVTSYLRGEGFAVSEFHGGKEQRQREEALYLFANGSANVLVGTDLASRGLDIPDVKNIVHYNLPVGQDEYVHRVGRTGRWQDTGRAFFLLGPAEQVPEYVEGTVEPFDLPAPVDEIPQPRMATLYIGKGKKDKISKGDIVGFLCKNSGLNGSDIGRIDVYERYSYVAVSRQLAVEAIKGSSGQKIKGVKTVVEQIAV